MAMMAAIDSRHPQAFRPVFRVASAGLEPRDLKLAGVVLQHSRYNSFEFRLLPNLDLDQADILLVNPLHPAGLQAILAAGAAKRRIAIVSALPPGAQPTGRHGIVLDQLAMQLLAVLNRVVRAEILGAALPNTPLADTTFAVTAPTGSAESAAQGAAACAIAAAARRASDDDGLSRVSQAFQPCIGQFHQAPPRARLQVVVADPSVPAQQQLTRALRRMGLAVHCVAGAADALQRLKAQHTDLVITESGLSDCDGFALIRSLRAQPGHRYTPVLLLRSRLHPMDATRARLAGDVILLTKPLTRQALEAVVRQALRASAVLDDLTDLLAPG